MFIEIVIISIRAKKFDEMTVTFHPINPRTPIMIEAE
tara:strand:- start:17 stop:127 length:111 start_codon:yes stop_codon:yes gene_type:complete